MHSWRRKEGGPDKRFYRYQPPAPAKKLLAEFWKLEKEAEKTLEGLAR
jgi:type I restriction enzyme M protein